MATYITIEITTDNKIRINFNDTQTMPNVNAINATYKRSDLVKIWHYLEPENIAVFMSCGDSWVLNLTGSDGSYPITSINLNDGNGFVVPTDMENLHDLLDKLIES